MEPELQQLAAPAGHPLANVALTASAAQAPPIATGRKSSATQAAADVAQANLDQRLTAVLRGAVAGFACDAAELYVLNASSSELVLRAHHQADESEPGPRRRLLSAARADVAAMAGSAIVLEDDVEVAGWPVPVWCGAAVCLPVASDATIHGTLWLYSDQPRTFADAEVQLAEVVAGRLAVELELAAWRAGGQGCIDPASSPAATDPEPAPKSPTVQLTTPVASPALEDWELAGWMEQHDSGRSFYDWQTLPDGRTLLAAGTLLDGGHDSRHLLQAARIALRAHVGESPDAGELLTRANHTLWLASPGGEGLSLGAVLLDGDDQAHASIAMAGTSAALRWRASTAELITASAPPLGLAEQSVYVARPVELLIRERLVLIAAARKWHTTPSLERELRRNASIDLRSIPGKRALRLVADAISNTGTPARCMALLRRR